MTPEETLGKAADYIEHYGWRQGWQGAYGEPACLLKAIQLVSQPFQMPAYLLAQERLGMPWTALGDWNDKRGRTKDEVIAVLRGAS